MNWMERIFQISLFPKALDQLHLYDTYNEYDCKKGTRKTKKKRG